MILLILGWIDQLVAYETERQRHVVSITAGIDSLYRLYSNDWTPAVLARSIGLMTVDALSPVKVRQLLITMYRFSCAQSGRLSPLLLYNGKNMYVISGYDGEESIQSCIRH